MYSLADHGKMVADSVRLEAYDRTIQQTVKPGDTVIDIGSGTGVFALSAAKYGAGRIYAIEPGHVIQLAREIAADNGYQARIEFIQKPIKKVSINRRADVIISDLRGILPLFGQHIPAIIHARRNLLAPGGILIPKRDEIWAAIVTAPELYSRITHPWCSAPMGLDMRRARTYLTHSWLKGRALPGQLLTKPYCWVSLNYYTVNTPHVLKKLEWIVTQRGTAHGMLVWFDAFLSEDVSFSNAPGWPELIYGQAFFPWMEPITLTTGDAVDVIFSANLIGQDYIWRWDTHIFDKGRSGRVKAHFRQSTFYSMPLSPNELHQRTVSQRPNLNTKEMIIDFR